MGLDRAVVQRLGSQCSISACPLLTPKHCFVTWCYDTAYMLLGSLSLFMQTEWLHGRIEFREQGISPSVKYRNDLAGMKHNTSNVPRCKKKSILRTIFLVMYYSRKVFFTSIFWIRGWGKVCHGTVESVVWWHQSVIRKKEGQQYSLIAYNNYEKQSQHWPLHTLLELQLHWVPPLAPFLLQELSTYQDVDYC